MTDHINDRKRMLAELREELVGPSPRGREINCAVETIEFATAEESYGPWKQSTGDEVLFGRDRPTKRYGVGILYPSISLPGRSDPGEEKEEQRAVEEIAEKPAEELLGEKAKKSLSDMGQRVASARDDENDELDLTLAGLRNPACMGVSFLSKVDKGCRLIIEAPSVTADEYGWSVNGRYSKKPVKVAGSNRFWWVRRPFTFSVEFTGLELLGNDDDVCVRKSASGTGLEGVDIEVVALSRKWKDKRLITVSIINRTTPAEYDESCLFQCYFTVKSVGADGRSAIEPYPSPDSVVSMPEDPETDSFSLLYRGFPVFAVGHGCAANWVRSPGDSSASILSMECLPTIETPSITADIDLKDDAGQPLELSMRTLAGLTGPDESIFRIIDALASSYERWISDRQSEVQSVPAKLRDAATRHLDECRHCLQRLRDGTGFLRTNAKAFTAFKAANHAILLQQITSKAEVRETEVDRASASVKWLREYTEPNPANLRPNLGRWRPFQLAFFVSTIASCATGDHPDRELVELIWFPTGGGKTEAYLGVASFTMFYQRLVDREHRGVDVIMRYTLRLLTTQQFQRASSLICAMEYIRRRNLPDLGVQPFSVGLWLGESVTPNKRKSAVSYLKKMRKNDREDDLLILTKCPWCASRFDVLETARNRYIVLGLVTDNRTVSFSCPDESCEFHGGLPVFIVDEDIFDARPSLVIGTVDKFANLIWDDPPRALFGIQDDGKRVHAPPSLIIQDELHLISGPLGSMVGHFEPVIDFLCTDTRDSKKAVRPKIISSTATIRRYQDQIRALYGRTRVALFPPPGLDAGDSFFGKYSRLPNGSLAPGRLYVGVHAPGLGSLQTVQTRIFTVMLQAPLRLDQGQRDPWWTSLIFYNSLRELGGGITLFQSDIPDYTKTFQARTGIPIRDLRKIENPTELTSRLAKAEVALALSNLEKSIPRKDAIDVCLASNIIEVGVDIDRLALMSIVGQPKTTAQYIQVSGRVGRRPALPGLVVTLYSSSKPRDRSHFEKFRSYHERLYAQVEPTSVTPFAVPVLERALHGALIAFIRQTGRRNEVLSPRPFPDMLVNRFKELMSERMELCGAVNVADFERVLSERISRWEKNLPEFWSPGYGQNAASLDQVLIVQAGALPLRKRNKFNLPWATQTSMRDVDAQCELKIIATDIIQGAGNGED